MFSRKQSKRLNIIRKYVLALIRLNISMDFENEIDKILKEILP